MTLNPRSLACRQVSVMFSSFEGASTTGLIGVNWTYTADTKNGSPSSNEKVSAGDKV